jgi:plasmid stabilization system protein ParE
MASKPVEFHEQALAEYEASFDWYFKRSRLAASKFFDEMDAAIAKISHSPQRWPTHIHGARKCLLAHFPFMVIYRELGLSIQVLAVAHCHRRPGYWKGSLDE